MATAVYWFAGVAILLAFMQAAPKWGGLLLAIVVLSALGVAARRGLL
jgi:hypothetical protein